MNLEPNQIVMENNPDYRLRPDQTIWMPEHVVAHLDPTKVREFNKRLPAYLKNQDLQTQTEL